MTTHQLSHAAKLDIAAAAVMLVCILAFAVALEVSAPVIAGVGAVGAAATGLVRVIYKR